MEFNFGLLFVNHSNSNEIPQIKLYAHLNLCYHTNLYACKQMSFIEYLMICQALNLHLTQLVEDSTLYPTQLVKDSTFYLTELVKDSTFYLTLSIIELFIQRNLSRI